MKQLYTLTLLVAATCTAMAQAPQKQLPAKVTVTLTDKQVLKIDSVIQSQAQRIDSKAQTVGFINAFEPFYKQISDQLIVIPTPAPVVKPVQVKKP